MEKLEIRESSDESESEDSSREYVEGPSGSEDIRLLTRRGVSCLGRPRVAMEVRTRGRWGLNILLGSAGSASMVGMAMETLFRTVGFRVGLAAFLMGVREGSLFFEVGFFLFGVRGVDVG